MLVTQSCLTLCDPMNCNPPDPLSMEFSKQEYWSGSSFPSPEDLPYPGIEPMSPALQANSLPSELPGLSMAYSMYNTYITRHTVMASREEILFKVKVKRR